MASIVRCEPDEGRSTALHPIARYTRDHPLPVNGERVIALKLPGPSRVISGRPLPSGAFRRLSMTVNLIQLQPIIALIAGILILIVPRLLNFIVAIYLIIIGITGLLR